MKKMLSVILACFVITHVQPNQSFAVGNLVRGAQPSCFDRWKPTLPTAVASSLTGFLSGGLALAGAGTAAVAAVGGVAILELFLLRPILDPVDEGGPTLLGRCSHFGSACGQGIRSAFSSVGRIPGYVRGLRIPRPQFRANAKPKSQPQAQLQTRSDEGLTPSLSEVRIIPNAPSYQSVSGDSYEKKEQAPGKGDVAG